jgi:flagellar biosynthesis protein FlhB
VEKRFPASQKKLDDLRKKGQVPKSQLLGPSLVFAFFAIVCFFIGNALFVGFRTWFNTGLAMGFRYADGHVVNGLPMGLILATLGPPLLAGVIGTLCSFLIIGPVFAPEAITPKYERVDPAKGLKRMFSMQQVINMLQSILVVTVLMTAFYLLLKYFAPVISRVPTMPPLVGISRVTQLLLTAVVIAAIVGIILGVIERTTTKAFFLKDQKMNREELVREHKESEGDPQFKSRRKGIALEALENDEIRNSRDAELMIVNPTHITIAVRGEKRLGDAPVVIAKGKGHTALRMRQEAKKKGIPIIQNRDLARKLFVDARVRAPIPRKYYEAVQQILVWVRKMQAFKAQQREAGKPKPIKPRRTRRTKPKGISKT